MPPPEGKNQERASLIILQSWFCICVSGVTPAYGPFSSWWGLACVGNSPFFHRHPSPKIHFPPFSTCSVTRWLTSVGCLTRPLSLLALSWDLPMGSPSTRPGFYSPHFSPLQQTSDRGSVLSLARARVGQPFFHPSSSCCLCKQSSH